MDCKVNFTSPNVYFFQPRLKKSRKQKVKKQKSEAKYKCPVCGKSYRFVQIHLLAFLVEPISYKGLCGVGDDTVCTCMLR